jgi:hypothetical protein
MSTAASALPTYVELPVAGESRRAILDRQDAEQFGVYNLVFQKARTGQGCIKIRKNNKWYSLKRCIVGLEGRERGTCVYHRDADPFNLRRENLATGSHRAASNNTNSPHKKGRQFVGVYSRKGAWVALVHVGTYPTDVEAAQAYNEAARKLELPEDAMNVLPLPAANVLGMFSEQELLVTEEIDEPLEFEHGVGA